MFSGKDYLTLWKSSLGAGRLGALLLGMTVLFSAAEGVAQLPAVTAVTKAIVSADDPLPSGAMRRFGTTPRHRLGVSAVDWSPDGRTLVTASLDGTAQIWNAQDGKPLVTLRGIKEPMLALKFRPDGRVIATGSTDMVVRLWDPTTGKEFRALEGKREHPLRKDLAPSARDSTQVAALAWSPDSRTLAIGRFLDFNRVPSGAASPNLPTELWDVPHYTLIRKLALKESDGLHTLLYYPDGQKLADMTGGVNTLAYSPDGQLLASAGFDFWAIQLWNPATGKFVRKLGQEQPLGSISPDEPVPPHFNEKCRQVRFSPDGKTLASLSCYYSRNNLPSPMPEVPPTLRLWDVSSGAELFQARLPRNSVESIAFTPDGRCLLAGHRDGSLSLWDLAKKHQVRTIPAHRDRVTSIVFSPDGKSFATGSGDFTALLWDTSLLNKR